MISIFICIIGLILFIYAVFFYDKKKPPIEDNTKAKKLKLNIMATRIVTIENIIKVNSKVYEFDGFIQGDNFELTSYQGALGFNQNVINGGTLTFEYLTGTSQLNNPPAFGLGVNTTDGPKELTFGSGPGSEFITTKKRIGKFRLTNSVNFATDDLQLSWNFTGYINTIFTGSGYNDITNTILFNIIIGDINMITINETQKVLLTAEPLSAKGNPAPIDGAVVWSVVSGSEFITITPVDNLTAYATAIGPVGIAIAQATADSDLGAGTIFISNTIEVEVIGGQAVTLNIIPGTPETII
jgi:hypothetical protein